LSSNDDTKFADYVAYRLDRQTITGSGKQDRNWQSDPDINPDETLEPEDYTGAHTAIGVDRGHFI
jgi:endonuclease G, mitochondrial